MDWDHS
jgi:hypothetical protein